MHILASSYLCYGYILDSSVELPWSYDYEAWYYENVKVFKPEKEIYSKEGQRLDNVLYEDFDKYWEDCTNFRQINPVPFCIISHGQEEGNNVDIIAVPSSVTQVDSWSKMPEAVNFVKDSEPWFTELENFESFVKEYLNIETTPQWYLAAYQSF